MVRCAVGELVLQAGLILRHTVELSAGTHSGGCFGLERCYSHLGLGRQWFHYFLISKLVHVILR